MHSGFVWMVDNPGAWQQDGQAIVGELHDALLHFEDLSRKVSLHRVLDCDPGSCCGLCPLAGICSEATPAERNEDTRMVRFPTRH